MYIYLSLCGCVSQWERERAPEKFPLLLTLNEMEAKGARCREAQLQRATGPGEAEPKGGLVSDGALREAPMTSVASHCCYIVVVARLARTLGLREEKCPIYVSCNIYIWKIHFIYIFHICMYGKMAAAAAKKQKCIIKASKRTNERVKKRKRKEERIECEWMMMMMMTQRHSLTHWGEVMAEGSRL